MEGNIEIIKVKSWDEMLARPNHLAEFEFKDNESDRLKLKDVIWPYNFPNKGKCALTCCRTSHANGFIISLHDGRETHIGRNCGIKYFGEEFLIKVNIRKAQIRYHEEFQRIQDFYNKLNEHKNLVDSFIYPENALGIYRIRVGIRALVNGNEKIGNAARTDFRLNINLFGSVRLTVQKTREEIELEKVMMNDSNYIRRENTVKVAFVQGYEITTKLQQVNELIEYFEKLFKAVRPDKGTPIKDIQALAKIVSDFPTKLRELNKLYNQGNIFFEKANLSQMALALKKDYLQRDFLAWVENFLSKQRI